MRADDNTTSGEQIYFDTNLDLNTVGNQGSVSFWFRYPDVWNDGQTAMLFDASNPNEANGAKYFYLAKQGSGALAFGVEDIFDRDYVTTTPSTSYAANEWVHVGVQWNMDARVYRIFLNGVEAAETNFDVGLGMPDLDSLVFGDNNSTYVVNLMSPNAARGFIDDIRLYRQAVSEAKFKADHDDAQACNPVDHYRIEHPSTAITCSDPTVTIKACANADCSELVNDVVSLQLTPSDAWQQSAISFSGSTTVGLQYRTADTLALGSSSQSPSASIQCSSNCEIVYSDLGFEFFNLSTGNNDFSSTTFVAESSLSNVGVRVMGGESCEALVNDTTDVELRYQCVVTNDASYTPSQCNVPFAGIPLSGGNSQTGTVSLNFDANGEANFAQFSYADAGQLSLTVSGTLNGASVSSANTVLKIVPDTFRLTADNTAITPAGEEFSLSVEALGANGSVLPGYQNAEFGVSVQRQIPNEQGAVDAEFYLDSNTFVQSQTNTGYTATPNVTFSNGVLQSAEAYMEETGQYLLRVRDNNYLGRNIQSNTVQLGRFTPAYFDVSYIQPEFENRCASAFTYVGQTFTYATTSRPSFTVSAYNAKGQITRNYAGSEWRLLPNTSSISSSFSYSDDSVYSGSLLVDNVGQGPAIADTQVFDGIGSIDITGTQLRYQKLAAPSGLSASPFATQVDLLIAANFFTDSDGICFQANFPSSGCSSVTIEDISGTQQRYGRLRLENTYGPETTTLRVPMQAEYLQDGQWQKNSLDNCTAINLDMSQGDIRLSHDSESVNDLSASLTAISANGWLSDGVSGDDDLLLSPVIVNGQAQSGSLFLHLIPTSDANHWSQHLNIDWDQDGDIDDDDTPTAAISFGLYRGNDKTIHWREVF
ncbi:DUF6701 domain-containing protein [Agaribacter flavus]|uniref:DUF6701 domain-containing protein n=1 Tax=Agaribacter flavus TaxID=1902781 RepID=A0ABV7FUD7_9ALTE